jgi:glycosyltransferase involved in cell wall biosynthesis
MDNVSQPLISVIMPVYNSEKFLKDAIESILVQTLADFELITVDDGSKDGSTGILEDFSHRDKRIVLSVLPRNQGVAVASNQGLNMARGKYIARMDADDISLPERFEKQAAFLETNTDIDIIGSASLLVDDRGHKIGLLSVPIDDLAIRWKGCFSSPLIPATIMFRRSVIVDHDLNYRGPMEQAEDIDFLLRFLEYSRGANFSEPLYVYRIHSASISSQFGRKAVDRKSQILFANLQKHFPDLVISFAQAKQVSDALLGRSNMLSVREEAADTYLRVWQAFSESCTPDLAFSRLQTNVVMIAAKLALYPPFQPGWRNVMRKISEIEPKWFISFVSKFPKMVFTKVYSWLIRKNRK